ncbi:MAG: transposase [Proteobacteria bacterium]|nr:transposase [Pseudomonadota bacterium]
MGFKKASQDMNFAEFLLKSSMKKNRCLDNLSKINKLLNWDSIEEILVKYYSIGRSIKGAGAYPPLLLFKCLLLQKWFRINSDPELECYINDRISFKKFLGIPLTDPSPAHSTFSRFRKRLSKKAMEQINSEITRQFDKKKLAINEGIAVDARIVRLQSRYGEDE